MSKPSKMDTMNPIKAFDNKFQDEVEFVNLNEDRIKVIAKLNSLITEYFHIIHDKEIDVNFSEIITDTKNLQGYIPWLKEQQELLKMYVECFKKTFKYIKAAKQNFIHQDNVDIGDKYAQEQTQKFVLVRIDILFTELLSVLDANYDVIEYDVPRKGFVLRYNSLHKYKEKYLLLKSKLIEIADYWKRNRAGFPGYTTEEINIILDNTFFYH